MYAVIKTGGKQYKVAPNDLLRVEKLDATAGDPVVFEDVLVVGDGDSVSLGAPVVEGAAVAGEIVEQTRDRKIIVFKKKRRQGYRRTAGHRQHQTVVRITEILTDGAKPAKVAATKARPAPAAKEAETPAKVAPVTKAPETKSASPADSSATLFTTPEGAADDLKKISGVGPVLEKKLNALGITRFDQIAAFTPDDVERIDDALSFKGRIDRDDWIGQTKTLAADASK